MAENFVHLSVLDAPMVEAIKEQNEIVQKHGFYLAGGTAIALHLGHRTSQDLDWFSDKEFDAESLRPDRNVSPSRG